VWDQLFLRTALLDDALFAPAAAPAVDDVAMLRLNSPSPAGGLPGSVEDHEPVTTDIAAPQPPAAASAPPAGSPEEGHVSPLKAAIALSIANKALGPPVAFAEEFVLRFALAALASLASKLKRAGCVRDAAVQAG
jgi:hypothetical protein